MFFGLCPKKTLFLVFKTFWGIISSDNIKRKGSIDQLKEISTHVERFSR